MKRTNSKDFMQAVESYLVNAIRCDDGMQDETDSKALFAHAYNRFCTEEAHEIARRNSLQGALSYWLSGLAIGIEHSYCDIIATAEKWHECKLTKKQADMVCASWFDFLACKMLQICSKYDVTSIQY